ncbi:MAG: CHAP domain-containing protein [Proteobacteria bacterium]|nr:CHAP domain-containing protein [Pseudomonadota bacterium]
MRRLLLLLAALVVVSGCATTRGHNRRGPSDLQRVLDSALMLLGDAKVRVGERSYRSDCSGFVTAAFDSVQMAIADPGVDANSGTETIYKTLRARGRIHNKKVPEPGDIAFFHNTWDRNGNKVRDDRFSHVALVESVGDDGTVTLIHYASGKVKRDKMNLKHPNDARDPETGDPWNSYMRRGGGKVLTGQLFYRFGRPLPK